MAGLGRRTFAAGEVLTASNVMGYLQDQAVMNFAGTAARGSAIGSAVSEGMVSYLADTNSIEVYKTAGTAIAGWEPVNLAQSPNAVINGAFDIWQRGTSFTNPAATTYVADRFRVNYNGTGATRTISRQSHTPGAAPVAGQEQEFYLRYNQSVAGTGGTYSNLGPILEDVRTLAGQTVTFSFYARVASGTISVDTLFFNSYGSGGSADSSTGTVATFTITTTWQRFFITTTLPSVSGKTIGAGSWIAPLLTLPLNTAFSFDIAGVQLEAGSTATPFRRNANSLQGELAACQRYYWRSDMTLVGPGILANGGFAYSSTGALVFVNNPVRMRVKPTSFEWDGVQANYSMLYGTDTNPALTLDTGWSSDLVSSIACTSVTGMTTGQWQLLRVITTGAYIGFSAEL